MHSFMNQATTVRRPVPMPGNNMKAPMRNMSASVTNLNHSGTGYPSMPTNFQQQQQQQSQNQWGFTPVNQVMEFFIDFLLLVLKNFLCFTGTIHGTTQHDAKLMESTTVTVDGRSL